MSAQMSYLVTEVMSASGPKLRLMLIEAALRFARQSLPDLEQAQLEPALEKLTRVRKILWELLVSVKDADNDVARNIRRVYTYLIRVVTEAQLTGDPNKVGDLIQVLEVERETWLEVSRRLLVETAPQLSNTRTSSDSSPTLNSTCGFSVEA